MDVADAGTEEAAASIAAVAPEVIPPPAPMTVEIVSPAPDVPPGRAGAGAPRPGAAPERVIRVTIGALEIHAAPATPPPAAAPVPVAAPAEPAEGGFAEFASLRTYARTGW
jgi:2-oxoglutarate dehydrogenase E2 component (dihydrolipoamide succinyltransferase)